MPTLVLSSASPVRQKVRHQGRALTLVLGVLSLVGIEALGGSNIAYAYDGGNATGTGDDKRSRGTWAALLAGYIALGVLTTAGTYLMRDNLVGRSVAVSAAGWGGLGVGAGVGYGLAHGRGCKSGDCTGEEEVAIAVGGMLGVVAATIAGHFLTADLGMSRPYTAAAGLTPALIFLSIGTIVDW
ncbi:MAG: hypothetical protein H7X95_12460 [Deltaproteobacteria bacterium]|nr:hypothetical protein [Deltaproteobacteria bacterium]